MISVCSLVVAVLAFAPAAGVQFPIEDPSGVALDGFFAKLRRTEKG